MIGAIIGDIVGSRFEWNNHRSKDFDLMPHQCFFTDDSIMSLAVCDALMRCRPDFTGLGEQAVRSMQEIGRPYPNSGYGGSFYRWMYSDHPKPYNSFGNGAAMRVSGCGYAARFLEEAKALFQESGYMEFEVGDRTLAEDFCSLAGAGREQGAALCLL